MEDVDMTYTDAQEGGAKTPKSSISLLSRESNRKILGKRDEMCGKTDKEMKLDLLQLALNNCESSIGPKKWRLDERTCTDKFQNYQKVLGEPDR